jgi:NAD+ diphosphatase
MTTFTYCPQCATPLAFLTREEDGGAKSRLRCTACDFVHWNNPTPVLAAIVQVGDKVLMARNAAWRGRRFGLITGFMEAGESPETGIAREVKEETDLNATDCTLIGAYEFLRMNQIIIAYHVRAQGDVTLSPELAEYKWFSPAEIVCWPSGTGFALAAWQRSLGIEPRFMTMEEREALGRDLSPQHTEKT